MEDWMTQVAMLSLERAPGMTPQRARDLADDLYRAWPEATPDEVVAKFFAFMPLDWKALASQH